ncbi:MAG: UDP-N-acetylglucosamine 1-carboxyvinyltransferase [Planctomycetaceae bacterium]|nr:UDP-N-acetylglucosamine 1-carboxyvinyltransferase [Planctomycetaceae bacterium]
MDMFVVQGGTPLSGSLQVSGAKNACLPIMAAALVIQGTTRLERVPDLVDVRTLSLLLRNLGVAVDREATGDLALDPAGLHSNIADYDLVRTMRASVCVLGPLLARTGRACVSLPGGCNIGFRPIDLHLKGLSALGADVRIERGYVLAEAKRLRGARVHLAGPQGTTVTGTCNVLVAAALAEGTSVIEAAASEPEVVDLANFLNACGAQIRGQGTSEIEVDGVDSLRAPSKPYTVIPDRIEAATLLIAAAATGGEIQLQDVQPRHLHAVLHILREAGCRLDVGDSSISLTAPAEIHPVDVVAQPFPAVPTDVQAQLTALLTKARGTSIVRDDVFPDRFLHLPELSRLGADMRREGNAVVIRGVQRLSGAPLMASDLRASAALVIAAMMAEQESTIRRIYHLDRGYERLEAKLSAIGGLVNRVKDEPTHLPISLPSDPAIHAGSERKSA